MTVFQVQYEDIERLTSTQLPNLLRLLLLIEAKNNGLSTTSVMVPLKIEVPDGGEDGRIEWSGGPDAMQNIPSRLTMFQIKAEKSMSSTDFLNANFTSPIPAQKKPKKGASGKDNSNKSAKASKARVRSQTVPVLKPQIVEVLDRCGAYIFFYFGHLTQKGLQERREAIREALRLAKRKDWKTAHVDIYDANKIRDWVNEHFSAVAQVCGWRGRDIPFSVQTWSSWSLYDKHVVFKDYVEDETQKSRIEGLRSHLSKPKSIARILGNPGLGKSRMALQALSSPIELRESVVYIDAAAQINDLAGSIRQFRDRGDTATIVIDNCSLEIHHQIRSEVMHQKSKLSLLTIDFDPGEETGRQGSDVLVVASRMDDESIRKMLTQVFGEMLPPAELDRAVKDAEGYPGMATLIAQDSVDGNADAGRIRDGDLLKRLLWGRKAHNQEAFDAIAGCSVFSRVGFEGDEVSIEREFVAKEFAGISDDNFYRHIQEFKRRRIVQVRGDFVLVVPSPLAARLAAEWWDNCTHERARKLITSAMPGGLANALCEQVKRLSDLSKVQEITRNLCGNNAPFSRAEVLNTEEGSLLFRAFCEVSPANCIGAMERAFSDWTREQLLTLGAGRRNLVWSLEKMCFWDAVFPQSARMLLRLAAAENETWGNNATGQFVQLYQLYLPGTQASLSARADVLESALEEGEEYTLRVITKAAERAFNLGHSSRMGGVEKQGGRTALTDYVPKSGDEAISYWTRCLDVLVNIACNHTAVRPDALKAIEQVVYYCVQKHFLKELHSAVKRITSVLDDHWYEARHCLDSALKNREANFSSDEWAIIKDIYSLLEPKSLEQKLRMWVTNASWDYMRLNKRGQVVDDSERESVKLVDECVANFNEFRSLIPMLLQGEQRNSFEFGNQFASKAPQLQTTLISDCEEFLRSKPDGTANTTFLAGILAALGKEHRASVSNILDKFAEAPALRRYVTRLTPVIMPDKADLARCLKLLKDQNVPVVSMVGLSYGKTLDALPPQVVASFCTELMKHSSKGAWTGLMLLHQYAFQSKEKLDACSSTFRQLLLRINLAERQEEFDSVMATYTWHEACERLLKTRTDMELALHVIKQMIAVCATSDEDRTYYQFDRNFRKILTDLFREPYLSLVWPLVESALCSEDRRLKLYMGWLVGEHIHVGDEGPGPLFTLPDDYLLGWARRNSEAASVLGRSAPLFVADESADAQKNIASVLEAEDFSHKKVNPLFLKLINEHGANEEFLRSLSINIHSFGGWGSNTPRYKARVELLEPLAKHKLSKVRAWARSELDFLQKELSRSQKIDDEHAGGIWERF